MKWKEWMLYALLAGMLCGFAMGYSYGNAGKEKAKEKAWDEGFKQGEKKECDGVQIYTAKKCLDDTAECVRLWQQHPYHRAYYDTLLQ